MVDELTPRDKWKIARIDRVISEDKNHVRRVGLTTAEGKYFERHLSKVVPLEMEIEEEKEKEEEKTQKIAEENMNTVIHDRIPQKSGNYNLRSRRRSRDGDNSVTP